MRKRNVLTALAAAVMVLQLVGPAGPASAQAAFEFEFTPTSGPPGTKIAFSGSGCPHVEANQFDGIFFLTQSGNETDPVTFESNASGEFSGEFDTTGLQPGAYTTFAACSSATPPTGGPGEAFTVTIPVTPTATYFPLTPARILDTRLGTGAPAAALGPGGVIDVKVTDIGGVPAENVTAVALNVVATDISGPDSYLTVWPTGQAKPFASNLNYKQGVSVPNLVIARVGIDGKVSMYNNLGTVNLAADVQGYFLGNATGSTYFSLPPSRILDTRNGTGGISTAVGAGGVIEVKVTDAGGVPAAGGTAVALNVTATNVSGAESYLTVWPTGAARPTASNLNFIAGQTVPNLVIARVGDGGKVSIYNNVGTVDVVADTQGYFATPGTDPPGSTYFPTSPARILDTRTGEGVPGGFQGHLGEGDTIDLQVRGRGGVPSNATAVVLNVTAADAFGPDSYLTVYPTGTTQPLASNLNFVNGQTVPNLVIAKIGTEGKVTIYNNLGAVVVVADVQGWFTG